MKTYQSGNIRIDYIVDEVVNQEIFVDAEDMKYLVVVLGQSQVSIKLISQKEQSCFYANCLIVGQVGVTSQVEMQGCINQSHCAAHLHMVTMLVEGSDCKVSGDVQIAPGIIKAEGRLLEENIVLGKKIKIHTLPKLDVRSNDVAASHGARIEKLDPKKLFYLQSKGISPQESKRLMVEGYVETMLSIMQDEKFKMQDEYAVMKEEVMRRVLGN